MHDGQKNGDISNLNHSHSSIKDEVVQIPELSSRCFIISLFFPFDSLLSSRQWSEEGVYQDNKTTRGAALAKHVEELELATKLRAFLTPRPAAGSRCSDYCNPDVEDTSTGINTIT